MFRGHFQSDNKGLYFFLNVFVVRIVVSMKDSLLT